MRYNFVVVGYVVMPEHFHLLMSEPPRGDPSRAMSALKFRAAKRFLNLHLLCGADILVRVLGLWRWVPQVSFSPVISSDGPQAGVGDP